MFSKVCSVLVIAGNAACIPVLLASESNTTWPEDYERDLNKWQEVIPDKPPAKKEPATNNPEEKALLPEYRWPTHPPFPKLRWLVHNKGGKIVAQAAANFQGESAPSPAFKPRWKDAEMLPDEWIALPVEDGWIIAFDMGEWGAGVVWYNKDGSESYEFGQESIQAFLVTPDGIFGQGGCTHMGMSVGALTRLDKKAGKWELTYLFDTPAYAPIQWLGNNLLVIVHSRRAFLVNLAGPHPSRDWSPFGPGKVRVTDTKLYAEGQYAFSETKVYSGGLGYVTELDLQTSKFRFLVPDSRFSNDDLRRAISEEAAEK